MTCVLVFVCYCLGMSSRCEEWLLLLKLHVALYVNRDSWTRLTAMLLYSPLEQYGSHESEYFCRFLL